MIFSKVISVSAKAIADHSPLILTGIGVTGTITTAVLTARASFKSSKLIANNQERINRYGDGQALDNKEKFKLIWDQYIPPVGTGVLTIACIIASNRIGTRRTAALATAMAISEKAWDEYKEKVIEKLGVRKEESFRDEIARDHINRNPANDKEIIVTGNGDVRCYDSITGRYFLSQMESLRKAMNDINAQILHSDYATLYDFYKLIGLPPTDFSNEIGWNSDKMLDLQISAVVGIDGVPCLSLHYATWPTRYYHLR